MKKMGYYLGLDIGTDSVGYAATDEEYSLQKFKGEPAWGVTLFDAAQLNTERRSFRTARRRLDRRQQRVQLLQEVFAKEIAKVDQGFYHRIANSRLIRADAGSAHTLFDDIKFTDVHYHKQYPTVHHLILDLMTNPAPHDVRLVYLACAWLVAHRGHFLSEVSRDNIAGLTDFHAVWTELLSCICDQEPNVVFPWIEDCEQVMQDILKVRSSVTEKYKHLCKALFKNGKCPKDAENFPYHCDQFLKALCGSKISAQAFFDNSSYAEIPSFSLGDSDEKLADAFGNIGDDAEMLRKMKAVCDWALLADIMNGKAAISAAKVNQYDQHKKDLRFLKQIT